MLLQHGFLTSELTSHRHVHVFPTPVTDTFTIPHDFKNAFVEQPQNLLQYLPSPSHGTKRRQGLKTKNNNKKNKEIKKKRGGMKKRGTRNSRKPQQTLLLRKPMSKEQLGLAPAWLAMTHPVSPPYHRFFFNLDMTSSTLSLVYPGSFHSRDCSFSQVSKGIPS